jgi:O-antigen ligase
MKKGFIGSLLLERLAWLSVLMMLGGMLFSRALLSMGMIGLFSFAVLNPNLLQHLRVFFKNPVLWGLSLTFLPYFLSITYSNDLTHWFISTKTKLAFIVLPFGFIVLRNQPKTSLYWLLYLFLWLTVGTTLEVLANYIHHFNEINQHYSAGNVMKTPYSHVRFSLLVSFAILTGGYLYKENFNPLFRKERFLILGLTVYLIIFIHILAVRSGLAALYLCALFLIIRYVIVNRKWLIALPAIAVLILLPFLAYLMLPSFRDKFNYVKYDLHSFFEEHHTAGLSDAARLLSLKNGIEIGKENIWLGVGAGDLQDEANKLYTQHPDISAAKRLPHNQFIWVFAGTGLIGLAIFCWGIFLPLFYNKNYRYPLFMCLYIVVISSFLTEATLEDQVGSCFYLVFTLLLFNYISPSHD